MYMTIERKKKYNKAKKNRGGVVQGRVEGIYNRRTEQETHRERERATIERNEHYPLVSRSSVACSIES